MSNKNPTTWKQLTTRSAVSVCESKQAQDIGVQVSYGAKHIKASCPAKQTTMMIPHDMRSDGVKHSVWKWLASLGLLLFLALCIIVDYAPQLLITTPTP